MPTWPRRLPHPHAAQATCSEGSICISGAHSSSVSSFTAAGAASSSASLDPVSPGLPAQSTAAASANLPPSIALITSSGFGPSVFLRRGVDYEPCPAGTLPSADVPCEPGAAASDPDGGGANGAAANLTARVVVCPPPECTSGAGCAPAVLQRHYFVRKGLRGCRIDPMAPEGTAFAVDFWVWDGGSPVRNASVTRMVTITNPCPSAAVPHFCVAPEGSGSYRFCSGPPCAAAVRFLAPVPPAPRLELLPSAAPLYVKYGTRAPFSLLPCPSNATRAGCGAAAWEAGMGGADLSASVAIEVADVECDAEQVGGWTDGALPDGRPLWSYQPCLTSAHDP